MNDSFAKGNLYMQDENGDYKGIATAVKITEIKAEDSEELDYATLGEKTTGSINIKFTDKYYKIYKKTKNRRIKRKQLKKMNNLSRLVCDTEFRESVFGKPTLKIEINKT